MTDGLVHKILPTREDDVLGFLREVAYVLNTVRDGSISVSIGLAECEVVVRHCYLQYCDDADCMEFILKGERLDGHDDVNWHELVPYIEVIECPQGCQLYTHDAQALLTLYVADLAA